MELRISENILVTTDVHQFFLHFTSSQNVNGEVKSTTRKTSHPTVPLLCEAILRKGSVSAAEAKDVEYLVREWDRIAKELTSFIDKFEYKSVAEIHEKTPSDDDVEAPSEKPVDPWGVENTDAVESHDLGAWAD